jgi:hypothetical protein
MRGTEGGAEEMEGALWQTVTAYQGYPFYTSSGLPFSYTRKLGRAGDYTGELVVSRKEGSKTLTKSSLLLAFHRVVEEMEFEESPGGGKGKILVPAEYKGPKSIGQIFGISYVYSLFWTWGLIAVPPKVEEKLRGSRFPETGEVWE